MNDSTKPKFSPLEDAQRLVAIASRMTYNGEKAEAENKHTLYEIEMRLRTGGYLPPLTQKVHTWADMEALTDVPAVFEALQAFSEDPTGDQGVFVVEAILGALGLKTDRTKEEAIDHPAGVAPVVAAEEPDWQHHAKKLTQWRNCMSYNDSYFGEPPGLLKQVVGELERLMPPHPVKAAKAEGLALGLDMKLAEFIKNAEVTSDMADWSKGGSTTDVFLLVGSEGPDAYSAIQLCCADAGERTLVKWLGTIKEADLKLPDEPALTICNKAVSELYLLTRTPGAPRIAGFDPGLPCWKASSKERYVNQRAQAAFSMYGAFRDGRVAFMNEELRDAFLTEAFKGELDLRFDDLGRYQVCRKTGAAPLLTGLSMMYSESLTSHGGAA